MATIRRGKLKGHHAIVRQWCNDWFSIDVDGIPKIVSPIALQLTTDEKNAVIRDIRAGRAGTLSAEFQLADDGTFSRVRRQRAI